MSILSLHHISIVCKNAQRTADFYTGVLGLRLVNADRSVARAEV